jgi:hypothetical protein
MGFEKSQCAPAAYQTREVTGPRSRPGLHGNRVIAEPERTWVPGGRLPKAVPRTRGLAAVLEVAVETCPEF